MIELDGMLSVIMPAYNEEKLIYSSIMEVRITQSLRL